MSGGVVSERRQSTVHLAREMFTRSQGWGAIELCAVLDIVGSRLLKEEPEKGTDLLVQQIINVLRKGYKPEATA
jgi:hypothetical protein